MGSWGPGTWDNDTAQDFLGNTISALEAFIDNDLKASRSDGVYERPTLAAVAVLRVIMVQLAKPYFLSRRKAESWQRDYLTWFDQVYSPEDFRTPNGMSACRQNIEREFQLLIESAGDEPSLQ